jgi:hypothetical protein
MSMTFWVNDKTRLVRMTSGAGEAEQAKSSGYREVTADEFDTFRAVSRRDRLGVFGAKGAKK